MATDSPDWQEVVTLTSGGSVPDAPDWQRTVTGPGAASISLSFPPNVATNYLSSTTALTTTMTSIVGVSATAAVGQMCQVSFGCRCVYTTVDASTDGFEVVIGTQHVAYGLRSYYCIPGYVGSSIIQPVLLSFWTYIPAGFFGFEVEAVMFGTATGSLEGAAGSGGDYGIGVAYT